MRVSIKLALSFSRRLLTVLEFVLAKEQKHHARMGPSAQRTRNRGHNLVMRFHHFLMLLALSLRQCCSKRRESLEQAPFEISPCLPNENWPVLSTRFKTLAAFFSSNYAAIFVAAWNTSFPLNVERILGRLSAAGILAVFTVEALLEFVFFGKLLTRDEVFLRSSSLESHTNQTPQSDWFGRQCLRIKIDKMTVSVRNNSPDHDPVLRIPLKASIPSMIVSAGYCIFRAYVWIKDVLALRALPLSSFETVN